MTDHEFTPDQIVDGIRQAIHDRDLEVVPSLIALLAVQDPRRAQDVLDTVELAQVLGGRA